MTDELIDNHHFSLEGTKIKYLKKGTAKYELCKDATGCPDVNTWPIKFGTKQKLGRTIPKSKNLVCKFPVRTSKNTSQTKISQLQLAITTKQKIVGLHVPAGVATH
jgi:hypothetical protein